MLWHAGLTKTALKMAVKLVPEFPDVDRLDEDSSSVSLGTLQQGSFTGPFAASESNRKSVRQKCTRCRERKSAPGVRNIPRF